MRTSLVAPLIAGLVVAASGCSFVAVRRPKPVPIDAPLTCTESRAAPALDTAGAIVTPVAGMTMWFLCNVMTAMQSWGSDPAHPNCNALLWATALGTGAYTGSAVYGYRATGECRRLMTERRALPPGSGRPNG